MGGDRTDFFVSHAGADRAWAEWVAWQLKAAGYSIELDVWDWAVGQNFVTKMSDALARADRVVALFSAAYFERERYTTEEWSASLTHMLGAKEGRLVPVRVEKVPDDKVPPLLRPLIAGDLTGLGREQAQRVLLTLANALGCARPPAGLDVIQQAVLDELRERERWLLVFDNAEDPEGIAHWLPGGSGHVLIASRENRWDEIAVPVEIDVLARAASAAILRKRVPRLLESEADRVAAALGDLPLAIVQAAAYIAEAGVSARQYADLLRSQAAQLLEEGRPSSYPRSLAAATALAVDRLRGQDQAAADLAVLCAFLGPEPIPTGWFVTAAASLSAPLADKTVNQVAWLQVRAQLGRSALVRIDDDMPVMHRLTQAIVRSQLSADQAAVALAQAEAVVCANRPGDPREPAAWPGWALLVPHLLALDPAVSTNRHLRDLANDATWYLIRRGDIHSSHELAGKLYRQWRDQLGPDDASTLGAASDFAQTLWHLG